MKQNYEEMLGENIIPCLSKLQWSLSLTNIGANSRGFGWFALALV